jgi:hypothetical protein
MFKMVYELTFKFLKVGEISYKFDSNNSKILLQAINNVHAETVCLAICR